MTDLATLGFGVDSSQVEQARRSLDGLRGSAEQASRAHREFALQQASSTAAQQALAQSTATLSKEVEGSGTALDALIAKLASTRDMLRASSDAMKEFTTVRLQVDALGKSFGVTSQGIEAYYRQAQQLQFSTPQTVTSLQRITDALANQTAAGQQVRRVLQDYGVSLAGLGINDADKALQRFTERMATFADSAQKFRSASLVLGPMDADQYQRINEPDYVSIEKRKEQVKQQQTDALLGDRARNASLITRRVERTDAELADARTAKSSSFSSDMIANARNSIGLQTGTGYGSNAEELSIRHYLAAHPKGTGDNNNDFKPAGPVARPSGDRGSMGLFEYLNSGKYGANKVEIDARYLEDKQNLGSSQARSNNYSNQYQNLMGRYRGLDPIEDGRQQDPIEKYLQDQQAAQTFAARGDSGLLRRQQASSALQEFQVDTINRPKDERSAEALKQFQGVYGKQEGQDRFTDMGNKLRRQRDNALEPGAAQMDEAAQQAFLLNLPPEQRGAAEQYLRFATSQGSVDVGGMLARNPSFDDMLNPDGNSGMSRGQTAAFGKVFTANTANRMQGDTQTFDRGNEQAKAQTAIAGEGSAALERLTVKQQAYNTALAEKKGAAEIDLAQTRALIELDERRIKQAAEMLGNMAAENRLEAARIVAMQQAGSSPVDRAAAAATQSVATEYEQAKRNGFAGSKADFEQEKKTTIGNRAVSTANDIVANTQQELKVQQDLLAVSGSRLDVQARFASDQKTELEFAKALGEAMASGDAQHIENIRKQIEMAKDLRDQLAKVNQEAKNFSLGRDLNDGAAYDRSLADITDPQQRRQARMQRQNVMDNRSNPGEGGTAAPAASAGNAGVEERKLEAFRYFLSRGDTGAAASGRLANLLSENDQLNIAAVGDGGKAYGIGQHHPPRQAEFQQMFGKPMQGSSYKEQLQFYYDDPDSIWNKNKGDMNRLTPRGAGERVAEFQERMADPNQITIRGNRAEEIFRQYGNRPGMASRAGGIVNADEGAALDQRADSRDQFSERQRVDAAARGQAATPGNASRTRAGYLDPTANPITAANSRDQAVTGVISGQKDAEAQAEASAARTLADQAKISKAYEESRAAVGRATRENQIAQEVAERGSGIVNVELRDRQLIGQSIASLSSTMDMNSQKSKEAAEDSRLMAAAYKLGSGAAVDMQHALETAPIEREIKALKEQGVAVDELTRKLGLLKAAQAGANAEAANAAVGSANTRSKNRNALDEADNDLGPMASDRQRARLRSGLQAQQDLEGPQFRDASPAVKQAYLDAAKYTQELRETSAAQQSVRDGMAQMGDMAVSSFNSAIMGGAKFKDIIGSLTRDMAGLLLKMAEKPLMNAAGDGIGGLLSGAAKLFGLTGGGAGAGAVAAPVMGGIYAAGGAFVGGERMFAAGGVLDRPTRFFSAGGQANIAGEAGNEAIMPLKRMPNGDMGVAAGGGGGRSIVVNAPITVSGQGGSGGGGGGKMDPAVLDAIQKQLADTMRASIRAAMMDEQRPGGLLY